MEYGYTEPEGEHGSHMWTLKGPKGAIHVWARENSPDWVAKWGDRFIGGVERHSPNPVYEHDKEPNHEKCWLLGGPCWHDGTSLYFSENIEPMLGRGAPFNEGTHEYINSVMHSFYTSHFGEPQ